MVAIQILAVIGFLLSLYSLRTEKKVEQDPGHRAVCDINDRVSCTATFKSKWGKHFGVANGVYGIGFYVVVFILAMLAQIPIILYLSILAILGSLYLAYILYFKLKKICLICSSLYAVNILLLVFSVLGR